MGQLIVQHYRGLKEHYNKASHGQGIYFATDTKEIILNGESYSGEGSESFSALQTQVQENKDALVVLNGTGEGSVVKTVNDAINEFASKMSDDGTVNTFKELVDYAAEHSAEIVELVGEVTAVKEKNTEQDSRLEALEVLVGGTEGEGSSLVETVSQHAEAIQTLQTDVDAVEETSATHASSISELQNLVGETSVSQQIEDALAWEDVE
mgnify:CR=1 FL=1